MPTNQSKAVSPAMVILAFATVYIVWGSTYFFIQKAIETMPPLMMGAVRFIVAGGLLLAWCLIKGEKIWDSNAIRPAIISGLLMLFIGNGAVIWAEKSLPSSLVAVLVSASPIYFVLMDKSQWRVNFSSRATILGLIVGFLGVMLLFGEQSFKAMANENAVQIAALIIIIIGCVSWTGGSLYSKYKSPASATVNTTWQMIAAGIAFIPASLLNNEWNGFAWQTVSLGSWLAVLYLIFFGSLLGYSAYVWLLQVRPVTQVSTYAYVNPVVAVLLGVFFAGEQMSWTQFAGLVTILLSVLLINLVKYRKKKTTANKMTDDGKNRMVMVAEKPEAL